ncbi:MAG: zinc ribbon domain-containing protein [Pyrinomonadaceae bacterium]
MDNKFCSRCGQANFPDANICTKCGNALSSGAEPQFSQNPSARAAGGGSAGSMSETSAKSNKKLYIIVGGILAVLVISIGAIILLAVGMLLYTNSQSEVVRNDTPAERKTESDTDEKTDSQDAEDDDSGDDSESGDSDNPLDDVTFPSGKDVEFGEETKSEINDASLLSFFLSKKSKVGAFSLVDAKTSSDKTIFPNRSAGLQAEYKSGSKKVIHRVAVYRSLNDAKGDIDTYKRALQNSGAKVRSSKEDQVIFDRAGAVYLAFYNTQGALHEISARDGKDVLAYYNSYFEK